MIEIFVKRPVTTIMLVLFLIILGMVAFFELNIERNPQIEFPLVSITATYPGASPEEIEQDVLKDIEDAVVEVSEIKKIKSYAYNNFGFVLVEFNLGVDVNVKAMEVKDKVEAIVDDLPDMVEKPIVEKSNPLSTAVIDVILRSKTHSPKYLYEFADKKLKPFLTSISGISSVDIKGGREREIQVCLNSDLMKQKFITILDVISAIKSYNVNFPGGQIQNKENDVTVRFYGEFQNLDEIKKMLITTSEGKSFTLDEIAVVRDGEKTIEENAFYNSKEAVVISLVKVSDGNAVKIAKQLSEKLPILKKNLEEGMELFTENDTTEYTIDQTNRTIKNIAIGILLTIITLALFTANLRTTLIVAVVLPTSLIATFFMIKASNFTINSMTLLAFGTVLGTLIANAIIILERALFLIDKGKSPTEAAIKGTKQVTSAVLASAGTNLAVFIPIGFMGGIVGKFMSQFGLTVVYATIFSIIVSFSLTPMMISRLLKPKVEGKVSVFDKISSFINSFLINGYKSVFDFMFAHKIISFILCITMFIGTLKLVKYVGSEFMAVSDTNSIEITIKTPLGSSIYKTQEKVLLVENKLKKYPEVESMIAKVGDNGVENATIFLNLIDADKRELSDLDLTQKIIPDIADIPDIEVDVKRGGSKTGYADVTLNIYGTDYDAMINYSEQIKQIMDTMGVFRSVSSSYKKPQKECRFIPNQKKLKQYGISNYQIASTIRNSLYGNEDSTFRDTNNNESYDIRIEIEDVFKDSKETFENMYVASRKGLIKITELGKVIYYEPVPELKRRDRQRIIQLEGYLSKGSSGVVEAQLATKIEKIKKEKGCNYYFAGNAEMQTETQKEMGKAFFLAVIFTYMVLAAIMNSYLHPFTIASSILTSFGGVFIMLFFTDTSINIASLLAIIMLVGLVVNGAILLIENAVYVMKQGEKDIVKALWISSEEKLRTILMTSIAIILGTIPQLFSNDLTNSSMGAVITGGMAASIFFTLTLTPLLFYFFESSKAKIVRVINKFTKK